MSTLLIKQGQHRAKPVKFGIWKNKRTLQRIIKFDANCRYPLTGDNTENINKLFGLGFCTWGNILSVLKGIFSQQFIPDIYHHTDSARFGWNYSPETDRIRIYTYVYVDGNRATKQICSVPIDSYCKFTIEKTESEYLFSVSSPDFQSVSSGENYHHKKKWSYLLNFFFGGDEPAPHDVSVEVKK